MNKKQKKMLWRIIASAIILIIAECDSVKWCAYLGQNDVLPRFLSRYRL